MKILNLIQCANLGGMEQASLRLMRGLKEGGDSVQLLSLNPIGRLGPLLMEAGIPHEGLPYLGKGGWRSVSILKARLKEIRADGMIMTGHHLLAELAIGDFCRGRRILTIHFHHGGVKSRWQWQLIYRIACRRFDAITFPCDFIRREAESIYPPVARLAYTIRYPLDVPPLPTVQEKIEARLLFNLPLDRPVVGNGGWLIPRKRFDVFLRTAREILNQNPDVLFVIAGDGPERENLEKLAAELGIAANVRWLGWQQDMKIFYKTLDVLLFNSDWDALGLTPLEAMSHAVPAVCSVQHGGLGELIHSDQFGFLSPTHDVPLMAEQVSSLLKHRDKALVMGLVGRSHIELVCRTKPIVDWHAQALTGDIPPAPQLENNPANPVQQNLTKKKFGRVAVLFHRVGPYHFARLQAAGKLLTTTLIEIFGEDEIYGWRPVPGADGFDRVTLFAKHPQPAGEVKRKVQAALDHCQPSVIVIPGWSDAVAFSAIQWANAHQVPVIVMSESTEWDESRRPWKEWIKRRILQMCVGGFVGGKPHAEYLARLGVPAWNIFQGYDAVDNTYFAVMSDQARSGGPETRQKLKLPKKYFLASARFVEKKNLLLLIRAYARYRDLAQKSGASNGEIWKLVLLGDGPLQAAINTQLSTLDLRDDVLLPGFKQYDELPAYYGLAQAFIHASTTEQWGLVVNEAMASGLPVLVSNRCGCAQDLVREGVNGFTFDPHDVEQLAGLMQRLADAGMDLAAMSQASREIISQWGPEKFADGLSRAVALALAAPRSQPSQLDHLLLKSLLMK